MNYYQILGLSEDASQDDIKKAYKKLAMKNHPDRGGDTKRFQEISQAYDTLSDSQKKAQYDAQRNGFNPFEGSANMGQGWQDVSEMFGFKFGPGFAGFQRNVRRNKDLTIRIAISLKQSYTGTNIEARFTTPSGKNQTVVVDIPAGIHSGQTVRYGGFGDDSQTNLPRGDLNVLVMVERDPNFERVNNDLHGKISLTLLEAMTGCVKEFVNLDGNVIPITIRPGVTNGTEFSASGKGFPDVNTGRKGNLFIRLEVAIPAIKNKELIKDMEALYARISQES